MPPFTHLSCSPPLSFLCHQQPSLALSHAETSLSCLRRIDIKTPNFSCILYALRVTHRAQVYGASVHFKKVRDALGWGSGSCTHQDWPCRNPRQDPEAMPILAAPCRRRSVWWWQTSTGDPGRMQRWWCLCLARASSPALLHKCP